MSKKKKIMIGAVAGVLAIILNTDGVFFIQIRRMMAGMGPAALTYVHQDHESENGSVVYITTDISPEGLMAVYQALDWTPTGRVAVKLSTGEPPASNYLRPELIKDVVQEVNGTIVENIVYISVMNRLSVDCDCNGNPAEPDMHDIGILASADPVALDQACVDLVCRAPDGQSPVRRMESRNAEVVLEHGEEIGLGSRTYSLVSIDG